MFRSREEIAVLLDRYTDELTAMLDAMDAKELRQYAKDNRVRLTAKGHHKRAMRAQIVDVMTQRRHGRLLSDGVRHGA